jgi:hypothetical protein
MHETIIVDQGVERWIVYTPHSNICNTIVNHFLKHPALLVKVALNYNYPR